MKDYIITYFISQSKPTRDEKTSIKDVTIFPLRMILFIISRLVGSSKLHVSNRSYMQYDVECLESTVFNWSEGVLVNMK